MSLSYCRRRAFSRLLGAVASLPVACGAISLPAQQPAATLDSSAARVDAILSDINRGRSIGQVAVSPDGKRIAWVQDSAIFVAPFDNLASSQRVVASATSLSCSQDDPVWSPDSASLAFLSDCAQPGEQSNLYLSHFDGNPAVRLTEAHGEINDPAFSPDGKQIAFLYVEGATRPAGALAAMRAPTGVIGEDGIEIQRVAAVAADGTQPVSPSFATPPGLHVYEFDWSPDSRSLAYVAADPPGENNWWVARLYTQRVVSSATPAAPAAILSPPEIAGPLHGLQIAVPRWSPDGKTIAFIGGLMSDQGVTGGDVWIVASSGGPPRNLTPNRPASAEWIAWDGNEHIDVSEIAGGNCRLVRLRLQGDRTSESVASSFSAPIFTIPATIGAGKFDRDLSVTADRSTFVFVASSFSHPPEIEAARPSSPTPSGSSGSFSGLTQLSHFNDGISPAWGQSVSVDWTNDGFHIQGWLLLPVHYDPSRKYPLLVEVHGGPASVVLSRWNGGAGGFSATLFSALGYFVLMPNPRGSFGQGEAYTQANRKDFGYGDLRDILAGVDTVLSRYSIDPGRIGLAGWSYGGFMTMFAPTQTHRFRAAVAGAGISDWESYYGENSIDQWMIPYFGASVYDDPGVYARSSAITLIKNVSTPTLVVVGDRDGECPAPQSFEFWHALRDLNVPTELVVYPNEGHGFTDPGHRRDVLQRAVDWFARYMPPVS